MKKIKILSFLVLLCSSFQFYSQNYLTFTPTNQSVTTNSEEEIIVNVRVNCYGGQSGSISLFVAPYSIPDNGYQNYTIKGGASVLFPGNVRNIEFKFKKSVTNNISTKYEFDTDYYNNVGNLIRKRISIQVSYNIVDSDGDGVSDSQDNCPNNPGLSSNNGCPVCNLVSPSNTYESDVTNNSAKLNWSSVNMANRYQIQYRKKSSGSLTNKYTSNLNINLSSLKANTYYEWRIRSRCSNSSYGFWSPLYSFLTLEECETDKTIHNIVNTNENILVEVSNNIESFSEIQTGSIVNYSAGNQIKLSHTSSNYFKVEQGSTFRAYIEGCTAISSKTGIKNSKKYDKNVENSFEKDSLIVYPNPSSSVFYISTNSTITSYKVINQIGKTVLVNRPSDNNFEIDVQKYPSGIYFIQLQFDDGKTEMKKLIKK